MWLRVALREIELVFGSALKQCAQERNWLYNYHTKVCWPSFGVEYFLPTNNSLTAALGKTPKLHDIGPCGQGASRASVRATTFNILLKYDVINILKYNESRRCNIYGL